MNKENELLKSLISPPGDTLQEHLDFIGMKPNELAERLDLSQEKVHDLIRGKELINADLAAKLENVLDIPSSFWNNLEKVCRKELFDCGAGI